MAVTICSQGPSDDDIGILLAAGTVLGWMGAWISAARHLRSIEPRAWRSTDRSPPQPAEPIVVPYTELSADALRGVLESFVLREGTEYGERDVSLDQKVAQVTRQLQRGEAQIVFDPEIGDDRRRSGRPRWRAAARARRP